ncbi:sigma-54-dependent transcriptional regulator [Cesiribacter andamanensis]|uniref:Transcriptional regulatory protein ZraR n=1 Tax=Cesiribacter andamanensis AMV16 TaxID=1279009 RepID=M7N4B7_9BACT|nr:sigma-54 dependent transcriptional regulator [Cesiribacter andamanensis]EMR03518.1 Transcriptional regulatory protein ZraR [Cesiribacter andamanensis AMV16]
MSHILVVDDDPMFRLMLRTFLNKNKFAVTEASTGKEGIKQIREGAFDILLTDLRLPDHDGIELLGESRRLHPTTPVILMTSFGDVKTAVRAIKLGAYEYVTKPVNPDEILMTIQAALKNAREDAAPAGDELEFVQGQSDAADRIREFIELVGPTRMSVLIQGESGTGKEYIAKMIHLQSKRSQRPFVAVDCGTLTKDLAASELFGHLKGSFTGAYADKKGQFQEAHTGTLFLDEVGNLPYEVQVKLLRALQERTVRQLGSNTDQEVDVRIIAATNEHLLQAVEDGRFREDLYHRLNEFAIGAPALRERTEDIELFARHFLKSANRELEKEITGFDTEVIALFQNYSWPGNLRELKNIVKRAVLLARNGRITLDQLPEELVRVAQVPQQRQAVSSTPSGSPTVDLKAIAEQNEREMIRRALQQANFNKSKAARLLNIDRKTLYNKLKLYGMEA